MARLLRAEMVKVRGCTEPAAIAYAALLARRTLGKKFDLGHARVLLQLSPGVYRNASTAVVPVLGRRGAAAAAVAGLYSEARGFDPFSLLSPAVFRCNLEAKKWIEVHEVNRPGVFIQLELKAGGHSSRITIAHRHDCVVSVERDGSILRRRGPGRFCLLKDMAVVEGLVKRRSLELERLALQFVNCYAPLDSCKLAEAGVMRKRIRDRMSGRLGAVMTMTGSGNQGIFLGIPLARLYSANGRRALPSILFALLTQIHLSQRKGRISDMCGLANKAGPALAAGIAHSRGYDLRAIQVIMRRVSSELRNMRCDGATPKCGMEAQQVLGEVYELLGEGRARPARPAPCAAGCR